MGEILFLTFELRKYEIYQIKFEITDLKTEKKQNVGPDS